jgi:ferredoxin-NADP reductase
MAEARAVPERLVWQQARVLSIGEETPNVKSLLLQPESWGPFMAGQHVDLRLTAPDGYQAQRSYSIASAPERTDAFELVIEKLEDGEVSPFFHDVVQPGDDIEFRGPIGGHFIWTAEDGGPIVLLGGGSGVVPLLSILRHRAAASPDVPAVLIYSVRRQSDLIFGGELMRRGRTDPNFRLLLAVTREDVSREEFHAGRIDADLVGKALSGLPSAPGLTFVCGSNAFVEVGSRLLLDAGVAFHAIKTERYGGAPT